MAIGGSCLATSWAGIYGWTRSLGQLFFLVRHGAALSISALVGGLATGLVPGGMVSILITAGPTREYLDDVRFLSNGSTGRMGFALAEAAMQQGHEPVLVLGPVESTPPQGVRVLPVTSALEMRDAAERCFAQCQVAIAAAAVADWRPAHRNPGKPSRQDAPVGVERLELVLNPDIVAGLADHKGDRVVVGFALESAAASMDQAVARGRDKLQRKQLDLCICNRSDAIGSAASETVLLFSDGSRRDFGPQDKSVTAAAIVRIAVSLYEQRQRSS